MKDGGTSLGNRIANQFVNTTQLPLNSARNSFMTPPIEVKNTLKPTDRDNSTVEAEKGETVVTNFMKDGIPEHYVIGGKRHYAGGTPLNLPENSFIFSRDKKLSIKDPDILNMFGKKSKKGFSPADIAKQYKLNDYRKVLADPDTSELQRTTAERMITNYNNKLGALAMAQESIKGFPDGIPAIAMGYLGNIGIDPAKLVQMPGQPQPQGMSMQGQPMRFGGQSKPQFMKLGGTVKMQKGGPVNRRKVLVSYQEGGTTKIPSTTGTSTKTQNIPSGSVKWDVALDGYDETQVQPGDYIKKADGKWYKVDGYTTKNYGYKDERLGDLQDSYGHLQNTITTNPDLQNAIYTNYQTHIQNGQLSDEQKKRLMAIPKEEVINKFLEGQKQVYAINASGLLYQKDKDGNIMRNPDGSPMMQSEKDLKSWETGDSRVYKENIQGLGFSEDEIFSGEDTAIFQAAYRGLEDASRDPLFTETLSNFNLTPVGLKDAHGMHTYDDKPISPVDTYFGNTTAGQAVLPKALDQDLSTSEVDWSAGDPVPTPTLDVVQPEEATNAPWWLQDIVKTAGAAGDQMRIKKYSPWQATPDVYLPDPTFFDPTRQLAANTEQMNIGTQGASVFSGPQSFNARYSQIQGQGAQNAANILGQVENQNVQVANQFEQNKAQILNQHSLNKSNLATQLYDKNVIANQQFDNSKAQARQMVRQSYIDAITNRGQTQALNELYPQYRVDPSTGGFLDFTKGRDVNPSNVNTTSFMDTFQEYKNMNPGVSDEVLYKMVNADMGMPDSTPAQVDPSYYANYMNGMPQ